MLLGCGSRVPITISPRLDATAVADVSCPRTQATFFVGEVVDRRGYADPRNIGFTQTGVVNVKTSLFADPLPAVLLRDNLILYLSHCGILAEDPASATASVTASLTRLQVTETTEQMSEEILSSLQYEVILIETATRRRRRGFLEGQGGREIFGDTTQYAADAVRDSFRDSLNRLSFNLGQVDRKP